MDDTVTQFRQSADRENEHRQQRRRYSPELQQQAIEYSRRRRGKEASRTTAAALGVAPTTLQRWIRRRIAKGRRFRPIKVIDSVGSAPRNGTLAIQITAAGPRVEGLTVESAARLLMRLR